MKRVAAILLGALLASAAAGAPSRDPAAAAAADAALVRVGFAPPLDRELRYRQINIRQSIGERPVRTELVLSIRFERASRGYALVVRYELPPQFAQSDHPGIVMLRQPLRFRVNNSALITALENEEQYFAGLARAMEAMPDTGGANDPAARDAARTVMREMIDTMRKLPADARMILIAQNVQPLIDLAASELSRNEPLVSSVEVDTVLGPVRQDIATSLDRVDGDAVFATSAASVPPERLQQALAEFAARMERETGRPIPDRDKMIRQLQANRTTTRYEVSRTTASRVASNACKRSAAMSTAASRRRARR